jgi:gamma-glutamylcyclotransferase (GGCT)/AIG2-like uncharacterized protein YtfP
VNRPLDDPSGVAGRTVSWPDRLTAAPEALFAYGTLQYPQVLHALIGRMPAHTPASAGGWRAAALPGRDYPGLVPDAGTATGLVITGLTGEEWRVLDAFEDEWYDLRELTLTNGTKAWSYTCPPGYQVCEPDWNAADFARTRLTGFVAGSTAWRRTLGPDGHRADVG